MASIHHKMAHPSSDNPMLSQAATAALRILLFRAGPQDFPHVPQLVVPLPALAIGAYFALYAILLPPAMSLVLALASVGALALVTNSLLSARRVANRFQQTFHALLATGTVLTLLSIPPMIALAPALRQIAASPELLQQPGAVQAPALASLLVNLFNLWNLAVYGHIFRHAADVRLWSGMLIALFVVLSVLLLSIVAAQMMLPLVR
jgi:hypothetical protein